MFSTLRHPAFVLILVCFVLGGCASKYGAQTTVVNYYPQCYQPIESLRQAESDFDSTVATTAVVGTLAGALWGFLATGDLEGAVVGAAVGAVGGTALGYAAAKRNEHQDSNIRMASYLQDLEGDIRNLDDVSASGRLAIQCYDKQFQEALASYKANAISRVDLDARYNEILSGTQEAERIIGVALTSAETRDVQYQEALDYEIELAGPSYQPKQVAVAAAKPKKVVTKPKKVAAAKPAKVTPAKVTPVAVVEPAPAKPVEPTLEGLAEQRQKYQKSQQELLDTQNTAASMKSSWAADLATLQS